MIISPRLEALERYVDAGDTQAALEEAWAILGQIDRGYGRLTGVRWFSAPVNVPPEEQFVQFATRFVAAFGALMTSPRFKLGEIEFERLQQCNRWLELMACLSGYGSMDSFIRRLGPDGVDLHIPQQDLLKLFALYTPHSEIDLPFDVLWHGHHVAFALTALGWLGSRYCFNRSFFDRREKILEWLPGKLDQVRLGQLSMSNLTEAFFHTSYGVTPRKHAIKAQLVAQLRRELLAAGCPEWQPGAEPAVVDGKPVIVVTSEYLNKGHSLHRTHSRSVMSLRERFYVVGVVRSGDVTPELQTIFDQTIQFPEGKTLYESAKSLAETILSLRPAIILHVAVGMLGQVIALASLRLAPVQGLSYGHMATTNSPVMDFMILPEDFVGTDACFSERLIKVPPAAMPYQPRTDIDYVAVRDQAQRRGEDEPVRVAVPGTLMKLNPLFFETLARIKAGAKRQIVFTFFPGFAVELTHAVLARAIRRYIPDAVINAELPYQLYCEALARQDFTLSPFPYGNMNTVIESVALGLPGVCLDGPESHAHTDGAIYARLGLPKELNAQTIDAYVEQAIRLIDDDEWLVHCRALAAAAPLEEQFYQGQESLFCDAMYALIAQSAPRGGLVSAAVV